MSELLILSVIVSIIFYELTDITPGGLIVPGLMVIYIGQPLRMLYTVCVAIVAYFIIKLLSRRFLIFGKRRFVLLIIISLIIHVITNLILGAFIGDLSITVISLVGYTVSGITANNICKQGVVKTVSSLAILSSRSVWYGALATYYVLLALIRGAVIWYHANKRNNNQTQEEEELKRIQTYKNCGILTLILNVAMLSAITQVVFDRKGFVYMGLMIYVSASYTFFKITMSIINFVKAKKQNDLTVEAIRNVNLIDAMVSILSLQTALLAAFQSSTVNVALFNAFTGIIVIGTCLAISILMIIKASKRKKLLINGNNYGRKI